MSEEGGRPGRRRGPSGTPSKARTAGATAPRLVAVRIVERVHRARAFADLALRGALSGGRLSAPDRALATELVYGTLRWRGRLDYLLGQVLDRDLSKLEPLVASTLRVGAYQLFFSDRIPETAAVDEAVRCARALGAERATGLVNAVLRNLIRRKDELVLPSLEDDPEAHLTHALSLPPWIAHRWLELYSAEEAAAMAEASNAPAPVTIRVNPLKSDRDSLLEKLRERHPDARACRLAPLGIVLGSGSDPGHDPAFLRGEFTMQDEASQLVIEVLDPQPGDRILDTCAAPGTKTAAIAERLAAGDGGGEIIAIDRHERRLALVGRGARRLGVGGIATGQRDATKPLSDLAGDRLFDRILVDAPCSGLGALRRNPDARWRVQPGDPIALAAIQKAILEQASLVLRPGGTLVYSTCTLLPEENEQVVLEVMRNHPELRLVPRAEYPSMLRELVDDEGFMRCLPHVHDTDGFFVAKLERTGDPR